MEANDTYYRIRVGDYLLGIEMDGDIAILQRFGHRRDFYCGFP